MDNRPHIHTFLIEFGDRDFCHHFRFAAFTVLYTIKYHHDAYAPKTKDELVGMIHEYLKASCVKRKGQYADLLHTWTGTFVNDEIDRHLQSTPYQREYIAIDTLSEYAWTNNGPLHPISLTTQ